MWYLHEDCKPLIKSYWNQNIIGCPMYVLTRKLQILKRTLKNWNQNNFCNVTVEVKDAELKLNHIQSIIQYSGGYDDLGIQEL